MCKIEDFLTKLKYKYVIILTDIYFQFIFENYHSAADRFFYAMCVLKSLSNIHVRLSGRFFCLSFYVDHKNGPIMDVLERAKGPHSEAINATP